MSVSRKATVVISTVQTQRDPTRAAAVEAMSWTMMDTLAMVPILKFMHAYVQ